MRVRVVRAHRGRDLVATKEVIVASIVLESYIPRHIRFLIYFYRKGDILYDILNLKFIFTAKRI